jgi:hypothetical protein
MTVKTKQAGDAWGDADVPRVPRPSPFDCWRVLWSLKRRIHCRDSVSRKGVPCVVITYITLGYLKYVSSQHSPVLSRASQVRSAHGVTSNQTVARNRKLAGDEIAIVDTPPPLIGNQNLIIDWRLTAQFNLKIIYRSSLRRSLKIQTGNSLWRPYKVHSYWLVIAYLTPGCNKIQMMHWSNAHEASWGYRWCPRWGFRGMWYPFSKSISLCEEVDVLPNMWQHNPDYRVIDRRGTMIQPRN